jgi:tetratricopeptide (TPR) repeat protein
MRAKFIMALGASLAMAASAAHADSRHDCQAGTTADTVIMSCTREIERDPRNAEAYFHRGSARILAGETSPRVIADLSKAIELKPDYIAAYEKRGRAYAEGGDFEKALADIARANELGGKPAAGPIGVATAAHKPKAAARVPGAKTTASNTPPKEPSGPSTDASQVLPAWARDLDKQ